MGVSVRTLANYKQKYVQILQALKKGKDVVDIAVENALLKKALSGETTAMIFWLKNRRPKKWRDKPQEDHNGNDVEDLTPLSDLLGD